MVHWAWLIVAIIIGAVIGAVIMAILAIGAYRDDCIQHFAEVQRLRDEIRYLQNKLTERRTTTNG